MRSTTRGNQRQSPTLASKPMIAYPGLKGQNLYYCKTLSHPVKKRSDVVSDNGSSASDDEADDEVDDDLNSQGGDNEELASDNDFMADDNTDIESAHEGSVYEGGEDEHEASDADVQEAEEEDEMAPQQSTTKGGRQKATNMAQKIANLPDTPNPIFGRLEAPKDFWEQPSLGKHNRLVENDAYVVNDYYFAKKAKDHKTVGPNDERQWLHALRGLPRNIQDNVSNWELELFFKKDSRMSYDEIKGRQKNPDPVRMSTVSNRRSRNVRTPLHCGAWTNRYNEGRTAKALFYLMESLTDEQIKHNTTWKVTPRGYQCPINENYYVPLRSYLDDDEVATRMHVLGEYYQYVKDKIAEMTEIGRKLGKRWDKIPKEFHPPEWTGRIKKTNAKADEAENDVETDDAEGDAEGNADDVEDNSDIEAPVQKNQVRNQTKKAATRASNRATKTKTKAVATKKGTKRAADDDLGPPVIKKRKSESDGYESSASSECVPLSKPRTRKRQPPEDDEEFAPIPKRARRPAAIRRPTSGLGVTKNNQRNTATRTRSAQLSLRPSETSVDYVEKEENDIEERAETPQGIQNTRNRKSKCKAKEQYDSERLLGTLCNGICPLDDPDRIWLEKYL